MNYSILETYSNIGKGGLDKLTKKTVAIAGMGGVGAKLAIILARNNISLRIVDKARVEEKDMPRTSLYIKEDISKFKAKQAKKRLEEINDAVKVKTFHEDLHPDNIFLLEADIIVDATNDYSASQLIDSYAASKNIPVLITKYSGDKGYIQFFEKKHRLKVHGGKLDLPPIKKEGVFSPVTSMVASFAASEVFKFLLGDEVEQRLIKIDAYKGEVKHSTIAPKAGAKKKTAKVAKKKVAKKATKKRK